MSNKRQEILDWLEKNRRPEIRIQFKKAEVPLPVGVSKIGGCPDVPADFVWPRVKQAGFMDMQGRENMLRPLAFMAQFNLSEISVLDKENLLPKSGHLLFFYDYESGDWGENQQCAKVFYFPAETPLAQMSLPDDMDEMCRIPELKLSFQAGSNVQDQARTEEFFDNLYDELDDDDTEKLWGEGREGCTTKLLGYADCVQNSMEEECTLRANGLDWDDYSNKPEVKVQVDKDKDDWILLFQLDTIYWGDDFDEEDDDEQLTEWDEKMISAVNKMTEAMKQGKNPSSIFSSISNIFGSKNDDEQSSDEEEDFGDDDHYEIQELMFGDAGTLYFWIRKQDLVAGRFDKVIFITQCH